jgi:hypothetical protein
MYVLHSERRRVILLQVWERPENIPSKLGSIDENSDPFLQHGAQPASCIDPKKSQNKRRPKKPTKAELWKAELRERIEKEKARKIDHFKRV